MWWARLLNNIAGVLAPFVAAPTNSYESIATVTVSGSSTTTISFTSIPSTYKHLQIRGIARGVGAGFGAGTSSMGVRLNSDSGSNYAQHVLFGTGSSANAGASVPSTEEAIVNFPGTSETANAFGVFVWDLLDYANTSKFKTSRTLGGYDGNNSNGIITFRSDLWRSTSAVTRIDMSAGFSANQFWAEYSSFALYGIKG
jgi:hypothetical protein